MSKFITYRIIAMVMIIAWATMAQAYEVVEVQGGGGNFRNCDLLGTYTNAFAV